jgi:hypothetical protein
LTGKIIFISPKGHLLWGERGRQEETSVGKCQRSPFMGKWWANFPFRWASRTQSGERSPFMGELEDAQDVDYAQYPSKSAPKVTFYGEKLFVLLHPLT